MTEAVCAILGNDVMRNNKMYIFCGVSDYDVSEEFIVGRYCVGLVLPFGTGIVVLGFECPKDALMLIVSIPAKYNILAAVCRNA